MSFPLTGTDLSLYESRAGVARAGATRIGFLTDYFPFVTINGSNRHDDIDYEEGISFGETRNQIPTASFRIIKGSKPAEGQQVIISCGEIGARRFAGYVTQIRTTFLDDAPTIPRWECTCTGWEWLLQRNTLFGAWGTTWPGTKSEASEIARDILALYAGVGITTNHVDLTNVILDDFQVDGETPSEALRRLADLAGVENFYIDLFKDAHFAQTDRNHAPHSLTETLPTDYWSFAHQKDITGFKTYADAFSPCTRVTGASPCSGDSVTKIPVESTDLIDPLFFQLYLPRIKKTFGGTTAVSALARQGSTVSVAVAIGATSIQVANGAVFHSGAEDGGYARVGDVVFRYHGGGGSAGAATLTGIPASGAGSLTTAVAVGATITSEPHVTMTAASLSFPVVSGDEVHFWSPIVDSGAAAVLAALDGSDGQAGFVLRPNTQLDANGLLAIAAAEFSKLNKIQERAEWITWDPCARPAADQVITLPTSSISTTIRIESVETFGFGATTRERPPQRRVRAETDQTTFVDMLQLLLRKVRKT